MSTDFSSDRWAETKANYDAWWRGALKRPLLHVVAPRTPARKPARIPQVNKGITSYDYAVTPEDIIDCWDYNLASMEFLGDAFPYQWVDFGPGVGAVFSGARPEPGLDTVWFHPPAELEAKDVHLAFNAKDRVLARIAAIMQAAAKRWGNTVQIGMTDIGGNLDLVSTFRPSEKLLFDLYDCPDEVKRITWEAHDLWWKTFDHLNHFCQPTNPGYTAWRPLLSTKPSYMLQCDFCYMISPEQFDEFVKPELAATCKRLVNPFYHLDGPGQIPHLDSLLTIPELKGVQWVPGAGQKPSDEWPELFRKIRAAGKLAEVICDLPTFDRLVSKLGTAEGLFCYTWVSRDDLPVARAILKKYGAPYA